MISNSKVNEILNSLTGRSSLSAPSAIYLGLSATEPDANGGSLSEPSVASYARKLVGGTSNTANQMFGTASGGVVKNNVEIQMQTARQDYGEKMLYWFLSTSSTKGQSAFIWGRIKDVMREKAEVAGFVAHSSIEGMYWYTEELSELMDLTVGETYIVYWDGKEYEFEAQLYESGDVSYVVIGNPAFAGGEDNGFPFVIQYNETTTGTETTGTISMYCQTAEGTHTVAI